MEGTEKEMENGQQVDIEGFPEINEIIEICHFYVFYKLSHTMEIKSPK